MRLAAGICVLSTGLLIGSAGGAIAAADTDTGDSAPQGQSVDAAGPAASPGSEPAASTSTLAPGSTLIKTVTDTLALIRKLGQENTAAINRQMRAKAEATAARNNSAASDLRGEDPTSPPPDVTEEAATPLASDTTEVVSDTTGVAPTNVATNSATNPFAPVSTVVTPVTNAVVTVMGVMGTVPGVIAGLPTSQTPIADVITSVTEMLTSVTNAVLPLASVPSDLYTLLAAGAAVTPATIGEGAGYRVGPVATAVTSPLLPVTPARPHLVPTSDIWAAHGDVSAPVTAAIIATASLSQELSISGAAPLATEVATPTGVLPVLEHAVRALLVPASLSALAALALPGVGGLLIVCAAGIRLGYRQAKAGLMLRASGILRFAGSGPFGVVRSGSLIALRPPRAARVARPAVARAAGFLDQTA